MKELKRNGDYLEIIEILEEKIEFSCGWNKCYQDDGGCIADVCSQVSCTMDLPVFKR